MLPIPFENFIPVQLQNDIDSKGQAFIDAVDGLIQEVASEILDMYWFKLAERCPTSLLTELGYNINAGIVETDSELTKRIKISTAVQQHKNRGTFNDDAKIAIDSITSLDSAVFRIQDSDDSIEMGQIASEDPTFYWSTEAGKDGVDDELGTWEIGDFTEYVIAGNILIDCHEGVYVSTLTSDQISQIVTDLEFDIVPAYMRVYLGYINTTGQFVIYAGGIIS